MSNDITEQETSGATGTPLTTKSKVLETGASIVQDLSPVKSICAHLNAFHIYADEPHRCVEANHYCAHINEVSPWLLFFLLDDHPDLRQCLIYDTPAPNARLIGIEYMISPRLYGTLPQDERKLWHSHVFEVKSGLLFMPSASKTLPTAAWEAAEYKEMEEVVGLYGKTYHFWQVDRGDKVPMGEPVLMGSFTDERQVEEGKVAGRSMKEVWGERDERFGISSQAKKEGREGIEVPGVHADADQWWKK
ncbi:MAG: hypothetical protein LQ350_001072 [Teloschistes chrysophthalmus]|nr:MAG: hypothetical protein LQ350_001072 [Niorma chrysophthalma]